jgi:hypothetical protein
VNAFDVVVPFSLGAFQAFLLVLAFQRLSLPRDPDSIKRGGFGRYYTRIGAAVHG